MSNSELSYDGPRCPHCSHQITPDDPVFYRDDYTEDECPKCERKFEVEISTQTWWETFTPHEAADDPKPTRKP